MPFTRQLHVHVVRKSTVWSHRSTRHLHFGKWDVSSVTTMNAMFARAISFNGDFPKVGCIECNHHDDYVRSTVTARSGTCQVMRYMWQLHARAVCTATTCSCHLHGDCMLVSSARRLHTRVICTAIACSCHLHGNCILMPSARQLHTRVICTATACSCNLHGDCMLVPSAR